MSISDSNRGKVPKSRIFKLPPQEGDLEDYINILFDQQKACESNGNYIEADFLKKRRLELKKDLESKTKLDLRVKHKSEKQDIESTHFEEFKEFNDFWDNKMREYDEEAKKVESQLLEKYEEDAALFTREIEKALPLKPKDSATLLNLKKIEAKLARQEKYVEANKAQQQRVNIEKAELEKFLKEREQKIKIQCDIFKKKKETEINSLRQRITSGQEEQKKARQLELERLLRKYQNASKGLELQQGNESKTLEKNIKMPSSVGINGLSKYYGPKLQSGSKESRENGTSEKKEKSSHEEQEEHEIESS